MIDAAFRDSGSRDLDVPQATGDADAAHDAYRVLGIVVMAADY
jgi:hypothetical protein